MCITLSKTSCWSQSIYFLVYTTQPLLYVFLDIDRSIKKWEMGKISPLFNYDNMARWWLNVYKRNLHFCCYFRVCAVLNWMVLCTQSKTKPATVDYDTLNSKLIWSWSLIAHNMFTFTSYPASYCFTPNIVMGDSYHSVTLFCLRYLPYSVWDTWAYLSNTLQRVVSSRVWIPSLLQSAIWRDLET